MKMEGKTSPLPWEFDHKVTHGGGGEDCRAFIMDANGKTVCDTLNSDVACIRDELDEDGVTYWDEQGEADLKRIVACVNALAGIESPQALVANWKAAVEALRALLVVMDSGPKPRKLDDALTWRECDERARAMADSVLAAAEKIGGGG